MSKMGLWYLALVAVFVLVCVADAFIENHLDRKYPDENETEDNEY